MGFPVAPLWGAGRWTLLVRLMPSVRRGYCDTLAMVSGTWTVLCKGSTDTCSDGGGEGGAFDGDTQAYQHRHHLLCRVGDIKQRRAHPPAPMLWPKGSPRCISY